MSITDRLCHKIISKQDIFPDHSNNFILLFAYACIQGNRGIPADAAFLPGDILNTGDILYIEIIEFSDKECGIILRQSGNSIYDNGI